MNIVLVVPTGIGCEIGGHAGDANPVAKLMGVCCDNLILHPNVVNSSDVNEMPENSWYVEGSCLDRFLMGELCLDRPRLNKILIAVNKADWQSINAVSGARATIGSTRPMPKPRPITTPASGSPRFCAPEDSGHDQARLQS